MILPNVTFPCICDLSNVHGSEIGSPLRRGCWDILHRSEQSRLRWMRLLPGRHPAAVLPPPELVVVVAGTAAAAVVPADTAAVVLAGTAAAAVVVSAGSLVQHLMGDSSLEPQH